MEAKYRTLKTIYDIVKDLPNPHTYQCTPRQIILRELLDWNFVLKHIIALAEEGFVTVNKLSDSVTVSITTIGIEKVTGFAEETKMKE
jgi:hypothetical protein